MILQYAWKGFWRRRTRSVLVVFGIALSVALLVAVVTISRAVEQAVASSLDAAGADMVIQKRVKACPFSVVKLPKDLAPIDEDVVTKLREHPGVEEVSGVLEMWAFHMQDAPGAAPSATAPGGKAKEAGAPPSLGFPKAKTNTEKPSGVESDSQGLPVMVGADGRPKTLQPTVVVGVDPDRKTIGPVRVTSREETAEDEKSCCAVARGRYLVATDDLQVMVTQDYAKAKGIDLDDRIPLGIENKYEVVALLDISGAARIAGGEAFITLPAAQKLLGQGKVVDTIFVSLKHGRDAAAVADYARKLIGEHVSITTEGNVDAGTAALASVTRNSLLAISAFVLLFALLMLVRNALENVAQRVAEVGLMKAVGWRNADVSRLFVTEAAYAAIIGGLIGSVLGSAAGWLYGHFAELKLPATLSSFPTCSTTEAPLALPLSTNPSLLIFGLGMALALAIGVIAGLAASRRAAKLDPVDALRRL